MKISNNIPIIEHKDVINTFTKNLKKKRKEKGFTQRQLADILDVKHTDLGKKTPYPKH